MAKRKMRKGPKVIIFLFFLLTFSYFAYNIIIKIGETLNYRKQMQEQEAKIKELKEEEIYLQAEKEKLENPEYLARYARGKFLLSKENEQILRFPSKK